MSSTTEIIIVIASLVFTRISFGLYFANDRNEVNAGGLFAQSLRTSSSRHSAGVLVCVTLDSIS